MTFKWANRSINSEIWIQQTRPTALLLNSAFEEIERLKEKQTRNDDYTTSLEC